MATPEKKFDLNIADINQLIKFSKLISVDTNDFFWDGDERIQRTLEKIKKYITELELSTSIDNDVVMTYKGLRDAAHFLSAMMWNVSKGRNITGAYMKTKTIEPCQITEIKIDANGKKYMDYRVGKEL